jgi:uncharacterized protein
VKILGLFAKSWIPGTVKTRLAATIGETAAALVHRTLVNRVLIEMSAVNWSSYLVYAPKNDREIFQDAAPTWTLKPQSDGDLGDRLQNFLRDCFDEGAKHVCLIGADCPTLHRQEVVEAFEKLKEFDVVLGPARDGGYYLIGLNRFQPELFREITWSSSSVLRETVARATAVGHAIHLMPEKDDIDDFESFKRNLDSLQKSSIVADQSLADELRRIVEKQA